MRVWEEKFRVRVRHLSQWKLSVVRTSRVTASTLKYLQHRIDTEELEHAACVVTNPWREDNTKNSGVRKNREVKGQTQWAMTRKQECANFFGGGIMLEDSRRNTIWKMHTDVRCESIARDARTALTKMITDLMDIITGTEMIIDSDGYDYGKYSFFK